MNHESNLRDDHDNHNDNDNDNEVEESPEATVGGEPLVLEGRIVAPPVKISGDDSRAILMGFLITGTTTTVAQATVAELTAATSIYLIVKSADDVSRQKLRAAAMSMEIGITASHESETKGSDLMRYEVARGQLKRLLQKLGPTTAQEA